MTGKEHDGHGYIREDFPGGWEGDKTSVFDGKNLSNEQLEALNFTKRLFNWRKTNNAVQFGGFTHFIPQDGVYVYFRHTEKEAVMIVLNNTNEERTVDMSRFKGMLKGYTSGKSVLNRTYYNQLTEIIVPAKSPLIIELN
jgi:glycosidase